MGRWRQQAATQARGDWRGATCTQEQRQGIGKRARARERDGVHSHCTQVVNVNNWYRHVHTCLAQYQGQTLLRAGVSNQQAAAVGALAGAGREHIEAVAERAISK